MVGVISLCWFKMKYKKLGGVNVLNIDYKRGLGQSIINKATFNLEDEKQLILAVEEIVDSDDPEIITGQKVRVTIKDDSFGDEELYLELGLKDGIDLIRILQRLFRQIANFEPVNDGEQEG